MSFKVSSEVTEGIATITLGGILDSASAPKLQTEIQKIAAEHPKQLALFLKDLTFMASAGLRMIIFAKQKLGPSVPLYMVEPQDQILDTLQMTGIIHSVNIVDKFPV
jgi:anti-anti-sigma factor